ncbi:hypothetical protein PR048_003171 [Dryococelus australis]|uniref:Uncharacterized protein n=1 Tax=Dryococelus australis TaxID=614101 RepID=A0ABQ9IPI9_9NEOP|nr:hypothetical protein PR048_003171 [Dryococelus australis]
MPLMCLLPPMAQICSFKRLALPFSPGTAPPPPQTFSLGARPAVLPRRERPYIVLFWPHVGNEADVAVGRRVFSGYTNTDSPIPHLPFDHYSDSVTSRSKQILSRVRLAPRPDYRVNMGTESLTSRATLSDLRECVGELVCSEELDLSAGLWTGCTTHLYNTPHTPYNTQSLSPDLNLTENLLEELDTRSMDAIACGSIPMKVFQDMTCLEDEIHCPLLSLVVNARSFYHLARGRRVNQLRLQQRLRRALHKVEQSSIHRNGEQFLPTALRCERTLPCSQKSEFPVYLAHRRLLGGYLARPCREPTLRSRLPPPPPSSTRWANSHPTTGSRLPAAIPRITSLLHEATIPSAELIGRSVSAYRQAVPSPVATCIKRPSVQVSSKSSRKTVALALEQAPFLTEEIFVSQNECSGVKGWRAEAGKPTLEKMFSEYYSGRWVRSRGLGEELAFCTKSASVVGLGGVHGQGHVPLDKGWRCQKIDIASSLGLHSGTGQKGVYGAPERSDLSYLVAAIFTNHHVEGGTAVAERLARSPPTRANRAQSPAGSPDFRKGESYRTMPLVGGFSRGSPVSPAPSFWRRSIFTSITLIGSQDLAVKSSPNHFTSPR